MTITAVKKSGAAGSAAWARIALLGVVATAAITGAAPAGADTFSDGCVYVCLFEHDNFGGKMTQQNPNRESLGGDWWNDQASSVATNKYPTRFYSDKDYSGCSMFLREQSSERSLPSRLCDRGPHDLNDQITSWRING
ncbi:peptidase inhibitor family I36 protein [Rathayibacter agropyri]|uniref:peptidase inhibitor family I36 protein n=1 Tax=Rathayibacter agropyri TaxID=1634927 RepID=UPI001563AD34|nr:peptidase inhibitor family I36 protein [Rathayibacter agropyri]NRD08461.1 peptidase inhibitor family I36 protein [Rathayibacter agropyri]